MGRKVVGSSSSKAQARAGKAESGNAAESHVGKCGGGGCQDEKRGWKASEGQGFLQAVGSHWLVLRVSG